MKKKWLIGSLAVVVILAAAGVFFFTLSPDDAWVLSVNGETIDAETFKADLAKLDPAFQEWLREKPEAFMEGYINHLLLLKQARKEGAVPPGGGKQDDKDALIEAYLAKKMATLPPVSPQAVDRFYEQNRVLMKSESRKEVAPLIREMLEEQQKRDLVQKLVADLRKDAKVDVNQKVFHRITAAAATGSDTQSDADFRKAAGSGKPMVVDFGANSCIPCRQLRPILQKVQKTYTGKVEILVIDIRYNQKLADEYKIRVIPTVVFFDRTGKEVLRHQGFMTEEKIKEQLAKIGVI